MKKTITFVIVTLLIVPNLVFAAWWNPLSWFNNWSFHKKTDQIQVLENKVAELERKLENNASSTPPSAVSTTTERENAKPKDITPKPAIKPANTGATVTQQPKPIPENAKSINYGIVAASSFNSAADLIEKYQLGSDGILGLTSNDADRYISGLGSLISSAQRVKGVTTDSTEIQFWNLVIEIYSKHRDEMVSMKRTVDSYSSSLQTYVSNLRNNSSKLQTTAITYAEAKNFMDSVSRDQDQIKNSVSSISTSYKTLTDIIIDDKETVGGYVAQLIDRGQAQLDSLQRQRDNLRTYYPPTVKTTFTNCNVSTYTGGGTINCFSY